MSSRYFVVPFNEFIIEKAWMLFHELKKYVPSFLCFVNLGIIFYVFLNFPYLTSGKSEFVYV